MRDNATRVSRSHTLVLLALLPRGDASFWCADNRDVSLACCRYALDRISAAYETTFLVIIETLAQSLL